MASYVAAFATGAAAGAAAYYYYQLSKKPTGFIAKVAEAEAAIGAANILTPEAAKALIDAGGAFLLDVQDPGSTTIKGSHSASLGTLPFKASTDLEAFKDPAIADLPKDSLIIVNCGLGGQAKLGAKLLLDYGFTNVKTIEGGCVAYNKACQPTCKRGA
eukprot:CAMPEP_0174723252 /NCGR_PEP_ID=MMETSP1094-20130205/40476_1 /TAXON_ID=156173 /ORGANISM="Chrysochromulina brevifilum, Strain UTEX LB 985" /LENGTH=158 /DNA_ID=CAMNT_0015924263 /DNA_START=39 /DNA_END=515 /DNA_ORIENTATION=+